jgi:dUTP pyrophosphatase
MITFKWQEGLEPEYMTSRSAGFDIKSAEIVTLEPWKPTLISTGLFIEKTLVQYGSKFVYELQIRSRSSLAKKGIVVSNGVGTVDEDYRKEIMVMLTNLTPFLHEIKIGDRIAQGIINMVSRDTNIRVSTNKRGGGFGSTST